MLPKNPQNGRRAFHYNRIIRSKSKSGRVKEYLAEREVKAGGRSPADIHSRTVAWFEWPLPPTVADSDIWYNGQVLSIHHCLFESMGLSNFTLFNDIDEFLVPRDPVDNWHLFIQQIESQINTQLISTKEDPETGQILEQYVFTPHSGYRVPSYFFTPQITKTTGELVELDSLHGNQQHNLYPGYDFSGGKIFQHILAEFGKSLVKNALPALPENTVGPSKRSRLIATPINWKLLLNASSSFVASVVTDSDSRTSRPTEFRTKCIVKPELVFEMGIHHISKQNVEEYSPAAIAVIAVKRREQETANASARGHPVHPVHVDLSGTGTARAVNERWVAERAEVPLPAAFFVHYRKCLPPTFDLQCEERSRDRQMRDRFGARLRSLLSRRVALLAGDRN